MIYSVLNFGYESQKITVEVDLRKGIPSFDIVGLADSYTKQVRELVQSSILNSSLSYPQERILVALSPCDLKKDDSFAFPMALAILEKNENLDFGNIFVFGRLELSGKISIINGIINGILTQKEQYKKFVVPFQMKEEIQKIKNQIQDCEFIFASSLSDAFFQLKNNKFEKITDEKEEEKKVEINGISFPLLTEDDNTKIRNSNLWKALIYSVSGKLNLLTYGKPGNGKTTLCQRANLLQPLLLKTEKIVNDRINSLSGFKSSAKRPFRMPHQTASIEGMCGGGVNCRCGEISLSHNGILFLDEMAEFRTSVIQMLRVPLESKQITLSRAGRTTVYPANFQLIGAMNPCPCGNYGEKERICLCSAKSIEQYWKKISGPLLDRIQIVVKKVDDENDEFITIEDSRKLVANAYSMQLKRRKFNNELTLEDFSPNDEFDSYLNELTSRGKLNVLKVARTIADTKLQNEISIDDIKESYSLCIKDRLPIFDFTN